jgi:alkylhydroperoxidase/carboxymuconolactone decarboxylase family protein YurZ
MAKEVIEQLRSQVAKNTEVEGSAAVLINGIAARIKTAVDAAIANGATAEELAPVTDFIAVLNTSGTSLAEAVAANT